MYDVLNLGRDVVALDPAGDEAVHDAKEHFDGTDVAVAPGNFDHLPIVQSPVSHQHQQKTKDKRKKNKEKIIKEVRSMLGPNKAMRAWTL